METNFNFKSQICTTREQSERLLALGIKKETADMALKYVYLLNDWTKTPFKWQGYKINEYLIPAWSLHRLLLLIPKEVNISGYSFPLMYDVLMRLDEADDMYEYTIGVLERTIKEGYFNKEYLGKDTE